MVLLLPIMVCVIVIKDDIRRRKGLCSCFYLCQGYRSSSGIEATAAAGTHFDERSSLNALQQVFIPSNRVHAGSDSRVSGLLPDHILSVVYHG